MCLRDHTQGDNRHVGLDSPSAPEVDLQACSRLEPRNRLRQEELYPVAPEAVVDIRRHVPVKRGQHVVRTLDQRHPHTHAGEVLGHLQPDVSTSCHDGILRPVARHEITHGESILDGAHGHDPRIPCPRHLRHQGLGARRQYEHIVALVVLGAVIQPPDPHRLGIPVDGDRLVPDPDVHVEAVPEGVRRLERQLPPVADDASHIVRESAVRIGHEPCALQHNYLRILVKPSEPGGRGSAAGNTTDDQDLHVNRG